MESLRTSKKIDKFLRSFEKLSRIINYDKEPHPVYTQWTIEEYPGRSFFDLIEIANKLAIAAPFSRSLTRIYSSMQLIGHESCRLSSASCTASHYKGWSQPTMVL